MRPQGFIVIRPGSERGIALITTLLVMMLMSALLVGFTTVVMSDQKYRLIDRDRVRSFYAAQSGLEKLNVDLSNLFLANVSPTAAQIAALKDNPPSIPDVTFVDTGDAAYGVKLEPAPLGCLDPCSTTISTGPYAGLIALKKIYRLDATARTADGGETHLMRKVETVAIPVFQFGMFSDVDLSFHAGPDFNFGGRVHSNGNLFLAQGDGATLTLPEKVTALKEVVRKRLANGRKISDTNHQGTIKLAKATNSFQNLLEEEGSVSDGPLSGPRMPDNWPTISLTTYNSYIRNGATGAKPLNLPLLTTGGTNVDLIRRPLAGEDTSNPDLLSSRYFNNVTLRILLSDTAAKIMSLPTVVQTSQPVALDGNWRTAAPSGYTVDATHSPIGRSPGRLTGAPAVSALVTTGTSQSISVTNLPALFKLQPAAGQTTGFLLRVTKSGTTGSPFTVYCSGKTATTFEDCSATTKPYSSGSTTLTGITSVSMILPNNTSQAGVTGASWSSTNWASARSRITVTSGDNSAYTPNLFPVTIKKLGSTYRALCSGKTQTNFTGCIADPTAPNGSPTGAVTTPSVTYDLTYDTPADGQLTVTNLPVSASWSWSSTVTVPTSITVASTMAYTTNTFWVLNPNSGPNPNSNVLVTCTGFQLQPVLPHQMTGCNVGTQLEANAALDSGALSTAGTGQIGGFIKIEMQDSAKTWRDVTMEFLNYGISGPNLSGKICDPSPNAIIRLQRLRDNGEDTSTGGSCSYQGTQLTTDFVPNTLFDTREALFRDASPGSHPLAGGVMHYVSINVENLSKWLRRDAPYGAGSGNLALNNEGRGFSLYFSDRRNNLRDAGATETGEFGFEDVINPLTAAGTPDAALDADKAEDVNASNNVDTYGQFPSYNNTYNQGLPGGVALADGVTTNAVRPWTPMRAPYAMNNRALLFRRALKLEKGQLGKIIEPGLTIAVENPVYVHGSWNASLPEALGEAASGKHPATSLVADAVTLLSDNWSDWTSFRSAYTPGSRPRSADSYYRLAIIAGKNRAFTFPSWTPIPNDFGSDGGAHNFLRMLEGGGGRVHYRGSIASFYFSRQAVGVYKCCATVYGAPERHYNFDMDFLDPSKLPPLTPVFRDTNSLGFAQEVRPGK
jgi:hypothetical protein